MSALSIADFSAQKKTWMPDVTRAGNFSCASVQEKAAYLDRVIPLQGASHAEVENYTIEIPMRYAIVIAILADGKKVRLKDNRKFVGWSGWESRRSYLFRNDEQYIEVQTDPEQPIAINLPGSIRNIVLGFPVTEDHSVALHLAAVRQDGRAIFPRLNDERRFIAPDGEQIVLSGGCLMMRELDSTT
jgi:hypothetical protein